MQWRVAKAYKQTVLIDGLAPDAHAIPNDPTATTNESLLADRFHGERNDVRVGIASLPACDAEPIVVEDALGVPAVNTHVVGAGLDRVTVEPVRPTLIEKGVVPDAVLGEEVSVGAGSRAA